MSIHEPHPKVKGSVESLLEFTPWTWKHLNTSLKVDTPVTVDVSLTSHYRLTGKQLNKFLRNDYIHCLTTRTKQELRVDVQKFSGAKKYAKYSSFSVASEAAKYKLTVGGYSGPAGDSLITKHNGKKFTTKDRDNDTSGGNCAVTFSSGWWYGSCFDSNLNGRNNRYAVKSWKGIIWYSLGKITLKNARMMIRSIA